MVQQSTCINTISPPPTLPATMNSVPLPTSLPPPPPLSRTSSSTSFSSEDDNASMSSSVTVISSSRRTRKRFTNAQLTMLENLFHQNSHPSREDREAVAAAGGMEIKSVTIWFQNKRQTERKTAANNNNNATNGGGGTNSGHHSGMVNLVPNVTSALHTFSLHHSNTRTASPPFSVSSGGSGGTSASRPSLDRVASRSELRAAAPRTPRRANPTGAIWDNMPSSPLVPPISPPAREFIELGGKNTKTRRTLEWACAAARLADKDGYASGMTSGFGGSGSSGGGGGGSAMSISSTSSSSASSKSSTSSRGRSAPKERSTHGRIEKSRHRRDGPSSSSSASNTTRDMDVDLTEEEDVEAITPPSTWGKDDRRWVPTTTNEGSHSLMALTSVAASGGPLPKGVDDDDMFKAALALCGLGRRT